jgi:glycosyltransferase involved in cell wall biosynthesis
MRTKNEERFVGQTLSAIFNQEIELPFEVIVIDSGSTDRTLEIVRQYKVRLYEIEPDKFTFGYALNYGAELAMGEYVINLSAHCIPVDSRWMVNLLIPLRSDPHIAATYGNQVPIKGVNPIEEQSRISNFGHYGKAPFSNSNCAIKKNILMKYPFDDKATFAEDFIWSQVLPPQYTIAYVPEAAVYHSHPLSLKFWAKRYYDTGVLLIYLKYFYTFAYHWPWQNQRLKDNYSIMGKFLKVAKSYYDVTVFLLRNGYFRYIPVHIGFSVLKAYYLYKGIKQGEKLYGNPKGQSE